MFALLLFVLVFVSFFPFKAKQCFTVCEVPLFHPLIGTWVAPVFGWCNGCCFKYWITGSVPGFTPVVCVLVSAVIKFYDQEQFREVFILGLQVQRQRFVPDQEHEYIHAGVYTGHRGVGSRAGIVNCLMWVPGTKLGFSERASTALLTTEPSVQPQLPAFWSVPFKGGDYSHRAMRLSHLIPSFFISLLKKF